MSQAYSLMHDVNFVSSQTWASQSCPFIRWMQPRPLPLLVQRISTLHLRQYSSSLVISLQKRRLIIHRRWFQFHDSALQPFTFFVTKITHWNAPAETFVPFPTRNIWRTFESRATRAHTKFSREKVFSSEPTKKSESSREESRRQLLKGGLYQNAACAHWRCWGRCWRENFQVVSSLGAVLESSTWTARIHCQRLQSFAFCSSWSQPWRCTSWSSTLYGFSSCCRRSIWSLTASRRPTSWSSKVC